MKFRITFEVDDDCVDNMEVAESRALAIALMAGMDMDINLTILNVEEVKESDLKSCPPLWAWPDTLETWVIGPDTGKGVDTKKINEELWKELEEYEKGEKE